MSKVVQQQIGNIALVVENYDDAIEFYTKKLQFSLVEDTDLGGGKRWVQVSPRNEPTSCSSKYRRTSSICR
ncbi:glyoxalase [Vibrio cholerae]|nr:hypothetical protein Sa5Y_VCA03071 [Vibrio cholerae]AWB72184.1 hypothetical protein Sa5Y_VCA03082 [Vibrio cholerae]GHX02775.1 glyoxalase [Vibrio cholerae]